jgi:general L-amino acid transport system substrate-binding protein
MEREIVNRLIALLAIAVLIAANISQAFAAQSTTLEMVKKRGHIKCGVHPGLLGFASRGPGGRWQGLDVDFCRAVAAATLGDAEKVEFIPVDAEHRLERLKDGSYEILSRTTTWTLSREGEFNILFAGIMFYDGQGFMARKSSGIRSITDLKNKKICVQSSTTTIDTLRSRMKSTDISYEEVVFSASDEVISAYRSGRCDAITGDLSALHSDRVAMNDGSDHVILPDTISKEPLGPAVRMSDPEWFSIVRWVYFALIAAEEMGITRNNVRSLTASPDSNVRSFLGTDANLGAKIGLSAKWAYSIVEAVGNYGEIFATNVGSRSDLQMYRGVNNLWSERGLLYSPPIR